jgi:hypothetical protein
MTAKIMRRWFDEVWTKGNKTAIDEMLAPDCVIHGLTDLTGRPVAAHPAFRKFHKAFSSQFSGLTISVKSSRKNADGTITSRCLVTGTHKASGKPVAFHGTARIRVKKGQICEAWNKFDLGEIDRQIAA